MCYDQGLSQFVFQFFLQLYSFKVLYVKNIMPKIAD